MKYYLIGPYPPPLGGVSIYAYRYSKLLRAQGHEVEIVDLSRSTKARRLWKIVKLVFGPRYAIFYLNGLNFSVMLAMMARPFAGKLILHDHSGRVVETLSAVKRTILQQFLARADECLLVGQHLQGYYERGGLRLPPEKVMVRNAFLPPPPEDEVCIWRSFEAETLQFLEEHSPIIIANAFQIVFYQGVDLYGLDLCIELIAALKQDYPRVGLLFALAEIGDQLYYEQINQRIDTCGVRGQVHFVVGQKELWPLFKKADVMIRPTYHDGYGVSIAEALYFGCPAVASDACVRPSGTVLFRNRDRRDLIAKVKEVLDGASRKNLL